MATLSFQKSSIAGAAVAMAAASAGGDKVAPNPRGALLVTNDSGASITVTVAVPGNTQFGQAQPDVPVAVPAGESRLIGPLTNELADFTVDGLVAVTYSATASVTVAAIAI